MPLIDELKSSLATSDSKDRKRWAKQIVEDQVGLENLLSLLHFERKTAQRFIWLIGDVCELDANVVAPNMPLLFSLWDQMPFPGMPRSVAKWLWLTNVPAEIEDAAIAQSFQWLGDTNSSIGCKSFAAKVLFEMAVQNRIQSGRLERVLRSQVGTKNKAFSSRMEKILRQVEKLQI